jgi:hypothetical protein
MSAATNNTTSGNIFLMFRVDRAWTLIVAMSTRMGARTLRFIRLPLGATTRLSCSVGLRISEGQSEGATSPMDIELTQANAGR